MFHENIIPWNNQFNITMFNVIANAVRKTPNVIANEVRKTPNVIANEARKTPNVIANEVRNTTQRHCERSEAIQGMLFELWIAPVLLKSVAIDL